MPRYRIFYEFYGHHEAEDEADAPNIEEALEAARDLALGNVSWGAELVVSSEAATDGEQASVDRLDPETSR